MEYAGVVKAGGVAAESAAKVLVSAFTGVAKLVHVVTIGALQAHEIAVTQQHSLALLDRKSTRLNSSHANISYAVFCLKKKKLVPSRRTGYRLNHCCDGAW